MVGAAMGLAARGAVPFPSTFACFLTRAADFIRMSGISFVNVKLAGSHAGISIGEDGPSQMALEDLSMMRVGAGLRRALSVRRGQHRAARRGDGTAQGPRVHADVAAEDAGHLRSGRGLPDRRVEDPAAERRGRGDGRRRRRHRVRGAEGLRSALHRRHPHPRDRRLLAPADRCGDADRRRQGHQGTNHHGRRSLRRRAAWATRSARRLLQPASRSIGSPCARSRAAASPRNCSIATASPPDMSSRR